MKRVYYMFGLLALFGVVFGAAATLGVNGGTIQAGDDTTLICDSDGVYVAGWGLETDFPDSVSNVRIYGISPDCAGNALFVSITDGGTKIAGGSVDPLPGNGGTGDIDGSGDVGVRLYFPAVDPESVTDIHIWIEGPSSS